jgi:KDO2-lipid IV(A) lauroyltransferase
MGPWEALTQLPGFAARHGIEAPFGAMYRPLNNTYLDDWFKAEREGQGTRLFSRRDGFHKPVDFLRSGGMLGILADQKMRQGPVTSYFGIEAASNPIPGLFHRRSGAPMLALSVVTVAPMRWVLTLAPVFFHEDIDLSSREALARITNRALEQRLACSPCDCLWMHKRF